eukprot:CAMPEP_0203763312 /NCGR_PEP_ID=MMETSP0098-20131031/16003_1 /ASSEMBLY_ACC=CAM_ASM_000208 /TAXON_ID=96639 /ORGANISM=" , Strain NY0313808BC1" /LENGTH=720 /DNA_ID=CAMNT_0050658013 /DNA_START=678 /DNA_END=2837 /DNA_ORIENTATION=-
MVHFQCDYNNINIWGKASKGWIGCLFCFCVLISCCSGSVRGNELVEIDKSRGSLLRKWAEGDGKSSIVVLAGNPERHVDELVGALGQWNAYLDSRRRGGYSFIKSEPGSRTFVTDSVSAKLSNVRVKDVVPWTVFIVENAEGLDPFDIRQLFKKYWNKQRCLDAEHALDVDCHNVLIALFTNFGHEYATSLDEHLAQSRLREKVEKVAIRELRKIWRGGGDILLKSPRRVCYVFVDGRTDSGIMDLMVKQDRSRQKVLSGHPKTCPIDIELFERSGFVGQPNVIAQIKMALDGVLSGLKTSKGPIVFLFAGAAGLGKTLLAKLVARAYNCGEQLAKLEREGKFLQIDMVNYQDERAIDGFVDPSPGLQGTGLMSMTFSKERRTVVLLDEIEKAHPSLLRYMLLPMIDNNDGHIQIKKSGERIPTKDAIFILTTNCFGSTISRMSEKYREQLGSGGTFTENNFKSVVQNVVPLMRNASIRCEDAHPNSQNPFSSEPLWRRLIAGHSLANREGMFVFMPPTTDEINRLVKLNLENYIRELPFGNIYYHDKVLLWLQRKMNREYLLGTHNMGTIGPFVESSLSEAIMRAMKVTGTQNSNYLLSVDPSSGTLVCEPITTEDACEDKTEELHTPPQSTALEMKETQLKAQNIKGPDIPDLQPGNMAQDSVQYEPVLDIKEQDDPLYSLFLAGLVMVSIYIAWAFYIVPLVKVSLISVALVASLLW